MNPLDIAVVALCFVLAVLGLLRGIVRQASSIAGLVLGHIVGVKYNAQVQHALRLDFPAGHVAAYLAALLGVYLAVRLIGLLVERWVRTSKLSGMDRFLGFLAGGAKGAILSVLLVFLLVVLLPGNASLLRESKLAPRLIVAAGWAEKVFPGRIGESFLEKERAFHPPEAPASRPPDRPER